MEMSRLILVSLTLVWCLGGVVEGFTYNDKEVETEEGKSGMFERWRSHHQMEKISDLEKQKQFKAFKHNLEIVHSTNKANKPYKLEMNRFAGMTIKEFKSKHTGLKASPRPKIKAGLKNIVSEAEWPFHFKYRNVTDIPPAVDWRTQGAVTPAKSQGSCASCYAFGVADAIESLNAIRTKQLVELSPKEILDCCKICGNCNDGGFIHDSFVYVQNNKGLTTEKNYPYSPKVDECSTAKANDIAVEIHGYEEVPSNNERALEVTVAHQPAVVSVECEEPFMLYKEGILTAPCTNLLSHAVLAVGYDTAPDGTKYWILKNSWGESFGEKGYIRFLRGVPEKEGYCGVAMYGTFPTVEECPDHSPNKDPVIVHMSKEL